jgi:NADH:ubiquinone oxidoreductase subunit E
MLPLPVAPTKADAKLAEEILGGIRKKEQSNGRTDALLQEVHQMQDGREVWVLQSLNEGIAYVVGLKTPIRVQGPYNFAK